MTLSRSSKDIWEAVLGELRIQVSKPNYETWLKDTQGLGLQGKVFRVGTPRPFAVTWLENRLSSLVQKTLVKITRQDLEVKFEVLATQGRIRPSAAPRAAAVAAPEPTEELPVQQLNPKYTFGNFTVGDCNRLACAAAMGVAEGPGYNYNPLFIHSSVGLGKTHLLHAIGNSARRRGCHVICTSTEQFANEFIDSVRGKDTGSFRSKFRSPDLLLLDDVHFISGKERTQESFYHTFNELYNGNRQIVITSDRPPKSLPSLGQQLVSRFEGGLVVNLRPPSFETRLDILRTKAEQAHLSIVDEVMEFLADRCQQNIRELEGAFNRVSAYARLTHTQPLTLEHAQQVLFDINNIPPHGSGLSSLATAVADFYNVSVQDLIGRKRVGRIRQARQMAMYLAREEYLHSLVRIGRFFDGRDHSTVLQCCQRMSAEMARDPKLRQHVADVRATLHQKIRPW